MTLNFLGRSNGSDHVNTFYIDNFMFNILGNLIRLFDRKSPFGLNLSLPGIAFITLNSASDFGFQTPVLHLNQPEPVTPLKTLKKSNMRNELSEIFLSDISLFKSNILRRVIIKFKERSIIHKKVGHFQSLKNSVLDLKTVSLVVTMVLSQHLKHLKCQYELEKLLSTSTDVIGAYLKKVMSSILKSSGKPSVVISSPSNIFEIICIFL
ncbi:hypothetical protein AGLY_006738 [Aphis glycines]|uniref:Uncharacterized protein n=1 Tax=Aphis glycines TaxID=307491 RepID=A0A6G0TSF2_APHGL|nr:hypothetical protein AGLY_006738 [Aphis glycines]